MIDTTHSVDDLNVAYRLSITPNCTGPDAIYIDLLIHSVCRKQCGENCLTR